MYLDSSTRLYNLLNSSDSPFATSSATSPPVPIVMQGLELVRRAKGTTASTFTCPGFVTNRMAALPTAFVSILGVVALLAGLALTVYGATLMLLGNQLGHKQGSLDGGWLKGGVGGVFFGAAAFGTVGATFTLLGVVRQDEPTLSGAAYVAVVLCLAFGGAVAGGRWHFVARASCAILGAISSTLLLVASVKPATLLPRLVILAIAIPICLLFTFLPGTSRSICTFAALSGAYLTINGIDLFVKAGFVDLPGLLVADGGASSTGATDLEVVAWGTTSGKELLAGWWLLAIFGATLQSWLGGENGTGDESWNAYLANFVATNSSSRGAYTPPQSLFNRIFHPTRAPTLTDLPGSFPTKRRRSPWEEDEEKRGHQTSDAWDSDDDAITMRNSIAPAKYCPAEDVSDEEEGEKVLWKARDEGLRRVTSAGAMSGLSGSTAVGSGGASISNKLSKGDMRVSQDDDDEESSLVSTSSPTMSPSRTRSTRKPSARLKSLFQSATSSRPASYRTSSTNSTAPLSPPAPPHSVPATPSLIKALDRVKQAQQKARVAIPERRASITLERVGDGEEMRRKSTYDEFWEAVVRKAEE